MIKVFMNKDVSLVMILVLWKIFFNDNLLFMTLKYIYLYNNKNSITYIALRTFRH